MREQADRVEEAFARRVAETEEATRNLEAELKQVSSGHFEIVRYVCYLTGPRKYFHYNRRVVMSQRGNFM